MENTPKTNGLALAGFIVSLVSIIINFGGLVGLTGTILSAIGLSQITKTNQGGKGFAIAGLIIGIISIIWGIYSIITCITTVGALGSIFS